MKNDKQIVPFIGLDELPKHEVTEEESAEAWPEPEPLPIGKSPVKPFDPRMLPDTFAPWIKDIAERLCCPMDFPAVGAMVALSSVVGRKCGIRPKRHDDWLVIPNFWGAVIGRPGVMKTPALSEALKPLDRLVVEAKEAHRETLRKAELAEDLLP